MWEALALAVYHFRRNGRAVVVLSVPLLMVVMWPYLRGRPGSGQSSREHLIRLCDVTGQTGINWRHTDGSGGRRYIVETVTAGLATFDYDGDLWIDIYFLNGAALPGTARAFPPPRNALFRNRTGFSFEDVTAAAGVGDTGFGLGIAVGDYNNDGFPDFYVNNFGPNVLYRNNGDGTFVNATAEAGVAAGNRVGAGAAFLDIDADSDLDLYVANYVKVDLEKHPVRTAEGYPIYPGPMDFLPEADILFRNEGDGTFSDISASSGIGNYAGTGMGMVCADIDLDGDTDIFVLNDVAGNFVFVNNGHGQFEELGLWLGGAYNREGRALGSMGIDCGDYDNDGWPDFYATSYAREWAVLFRNLGGGRMEDVTAATGAGAGTFAHVTWGTAFADLDNDEDRDLVVACGHLQDNVELFDPTGAYRVENVVLENLGGRFRDISRSAGDGLRPRRSSRGLAADDLDNDGRVDIAVLNSREEPTIIANCSPCSEYHWVEIQLVGIRTNRDGVGSRVGLQTGQLVQWAEVHSGRGYQSHFGSRLHFGLGRFSHIDELQIRWHSGHRDCFVNIPADQVLIAIESVGLFPAPCRSKK
ncbi:MAG: CRTAC1 family protein [Thermoguttaceae bacterium]|nr:CRTAC1 family protein [Thermoguttaceae bacterium]MDW8079342.1 CRTAC1 family protein [Thermoguttaceae bacterium]